MLLQDCDRRLALWFATRPFALKIFKEARMYLSIDRPRPLNKRAIILLNGKRVDRVIEADDKEGFVTLFDWDAKEYTTLHGKVKILDQAEIDVHAAYTRCDKG